MQKIIPHLWFDGEAREAAEFYTAAFDHARINHLNIIRDTPSGDVEIVEFQIMGCDFVALSAGPDFKINPSISFHTRCRTVEEVERLWGKLSPGGTVMMELGEYPFSKQYGWIQDKYGVSWQVIHSDEDTAVRIVPALMFVGDVCGKAEEAIHFYASVFPGGKAQVLSRYFEGEQPDKPGTVKFSQFNLFGQDFGAMDSAWKHDFRFNEAVSLMVNCKDQQEIDYFWERLSASPEAEQCGWIKDKYGVSWQIVPANMRTLIGKNPERTTPVLLQMKKIVIADLEKAGEVRKKW